MESPEVTFTLAYLVFSVCFVFTPNELHAAGVTAQSLLGAWLGSETQGFVQYQQRRTALVGVSHSLIPLGYFLGMCFAASDRQFYNVYEASAGWQIFFTLAVLLPVFTSMLVIYWSRNQWGNHPLSRTLARHAIAHSEWRAVASSLNTEFRRIDNFTTGSPGSRVIVTDTWVVKVTTYYVCVAQQQDIHLTVTNSKYHDIAAESFTPVQLLTIRVSSINPHVKPFDIRLSSTEYSELREKLHAPIRNAANVVIHQTLSDMFLDTFRSYVDENEPYPLPSSQELEPCIGCMQINANIKLVKKCREPDEGECKQCYCRPMWCLTCMGKWFASRQNQQHPETWLASHVPCPTCRAQFCILDVCVVR